MKPGWEIKQLGTVSAINYGYTESASSDPVGPRFLRITDIQNDHVDWDSVPYCKIQSSDVAKYRLASSDIVFARTGATTGKSFLVNEPPDAVFASYLIRLRLLDKKLLPEFVSLFFQTDGYWKSIKDGSAGSAQGGFNAAKLGALSIPIPPLTEQRRLVGILDEAFEGIATAKANAEKNLQNARALFESHLQSVFTQRGEGWVEQTLADICIKITDGEHLRPKVTTSGVPFLSAKDVLDHDVVFTDSLFVSETDALKFRRRCNPEMGDILIVSRGATVGRSCIVKTSRVFCLLGSVILLKVGTALSPHFIAYALKSPTIKDRLTASSEAAAQQAIYLRDIKPLKIGCPSLTEQLMIVSKLDSLAAETQRLESLYQRKLAALDALKKSLLHQAFSGQL